MHIFGLCAIDRLIAIRDRGIAHNLIGEPENEFDRVCLRFPDNINQFSGDLDIVITGYPCLSDNENRMCLSDQPMPDANFRSHITYTSICNSAKIPFNALGLSQRVFVSLL